MIDFIINSARCSNCHLTMYLHRSSRWLTTALIIGVDLSEDDGNKILSMRVHNLRHTCLFGRMGCPALDLRDFLKDVTGNNQRQSWTRSRSAGPTREPENALKGEPQSCSRYSPKPKVKTKVTYLSLLMSSFRIGCSQ